MLIRIFKYFEILYDTQKVNILRRDFHKLTAYATLLLVIGTIVLAGAAILTLIVTHRDTIEALTTVQRAFVYTRELQFVPRIADDPFNPSNHPLSWWFTPIIENSGSTPTKQMRIVVIASCGTQPLRVNFGFGPKQSMICQDMPDAGPPDPGEIMTHASDYKGLNLITASLGPKAQTPVGGFGMPPDYIREFPTVAKISTTVAAELLVRSPSSGCSAQLSGPR